MLHAEKRDDNELIVFTHLGEIHVSIKLYPGSNSSIKVDVLPDIGCTVKRGSSPDSIELRNTRIGQEKLSVK